jgi:hypothetical protein
LAKYGDVAAARAKPFVTEELAPNALFKRAIPLLFS